jgi:hypothetical protein
MEGGFLYPLTLLASRSLSYWAEVLFRHKTRENPLLEEDSPIRAKKRVVVWSLPNRSAVPPLKREKSLWWRGFSPLSKKRTFDELVSREKGARLQYVGGLLVL